MQNTCRNGILFPILFWPTVRNFFFDDQEKRLEFKTEDWKFAKIMESLEKFVQTMKGQDNFSSRILF